MGKAKRKHQYWAYQLENGRWQGEVVGDSRLTVERVSEEQALVDIEKLHNEVMQDDRYLDGLNGGAA